MTDYEKKWLFFLTPIMIVYAVYEIKRGYIIICGKGYYPSVIDKVIRGMIRQKNNIEEDITPFEQKIIANRRRVEGFSSLIGGILTIEVFCWLYYVLLV